MKKPFYFLIIFSIISCSENKKEKTILTENTNTENTELSIETSQISEIDSSGILMMPLSIASTTEDSKFSGSLESRKGNLLWNIVFYNTKTSEKYLLSSNKILISNYDSEYGYSSDPNPETSINRNSSKKYIFYRIRNTDSNKNGILDSEDPEYLFFTERNGKNLKQISKPLTHLTNWTFVESSKKVIFNAIEDKNKDGKWDEKDEIVTYEYQLTSERMSVEIYPQNFKNLLKENFKKNWKKQ